MSFFSDAVTLVFAFALLLSVLVFVHELGHFVVARACGVRVLKFSIGFGPPVGFGRHRLSWTRGGTEYVIAWFPLGGFVKMLGENPDEAEDPEVTAHPGESLPEKPLWQKLAIVFAGPVANLILPVVVFVGTLAVGVPRPVPVLGHVEPGSPAAEAGLRPGDRVITLGGEALHWWVDLDDRVRERPGQTLPVAYERDGQLDTADLAIGRRAGVDDFGTVIEVGWAGLEHRRLAAMLGVGSTRAPAHRAGLRSGEVVTAVNGEAVEDWVGFARAYAAAGRGGPVTLTLAPSTAEGAEPRTVRVPGLGDVDRLGVIPANVLVAEVKPDSAAAEAGLAAGDLILSVDGEPVGSFASFAENVRTSGGRPLALAYARAGAVREVTIAPRLEDYDAGTGIAEPRYLVGITAELASSLTGASALDRELNPLVSVPRAVGMTVEVTTTFLAGLGKLVTGDVSRKQLAGPIGIARIAGTAFKRGWDDYLYMLVLISINLGILNLLPIPVLDGGQAVLFTVEGIHGGKLSLRTREIVQQIGLTVLLLLMGLAFWNDLSREWSRLLDWLGGA